MKPPVNQTGESDVGHNVWPYATPTPPLARPLWYRVCWFVLLCAVVMLYVIIGQRYFWD